MAEYAKRTCHSCGIRLPQPQMRRLTIEPIGVRGNLLAAREVWICDRCFPQWKLKDPYYRMLAEHDARRIDAENKKYADGKRLWAEEQERRRLANIERRTKS